jgi:glycosyltransferase involved in cell wall biosynthesis
MTPLISVIMPVYNAAAFLQLAIESVLSQADCSFELIAVNDGSTDNSGELLNAVRDSRLRVLNQPNAGQSAAINHGVSVARGDFIKLVDADDWINPGHLAAQLRSLKGYPDCVSACRWGYFREDFRRPAVRSEHANRDYTDPIEWIVDSLTLDEGMMGGWKWLIPRAVWARAGGHDPRLSLNNDFHASIAILLASNGVRLAPEAIYSYRKGLPAALSGTRSRKALQSALLTTQLGCQLLLSREDSPRIRRLCATRYQRWAYDFYPQQPDLAQAAEQAADALGGAVVPFPGSMTARLASAIIGWRAVRRLQSLAGHFGWAHIRRLKQSLRERKLR